MISARLKSYDLFVILIFSIVFWVLLFTNTEGVLRVALGFLFVGFMPGYVILRIFPSNLNFFHLLLLSIPVSLSIATITGLLSTIVFSNYVQTFSQAILIEIIILAFSFLGIIFPKNLSKNELGLYFSIILILSFFVVVSYFARATPTQNDVAILEFEGIANEKFPITLAKDSAYPLQVGVELGGNVIVPVGLVCSHDTLAVSIDTNNSKYFYPIEFKSDTLGLNSLECSLGNEHMIRRIKVLFNIVEP
jgi:hypothetical protein